MHWWQNYKQLVAIRLKSQMIYRKSYLIEMLGHFLFIFTHFGAIAVIFYNVPTLRGWTQMEVFYLFGLTSLSFSIAQLASEGFEDLALYIKAGEFDRFLLRPVSPLLQMASLSFKIDRFGGILQGAIVFCWAAYQSGAINSGASFCLALSSLLSLTLVYYGLSIANGAFCFWTVENSEVFNAFTFGGLEACKYPLSIYKNWLQNLFLYVIPIGFVSYLPAVALFNKVPDLSSIPPHGWWAPVVALTFVCIIWRFWHFSLKHYQSIGS